MITFNGTDLSDYMRINTIDRGGIIPPRVLETLDIPQRVGLYLINAKTGARVINVGVTIIGVSLEEIRDRMEIIGDILRTDEPVPIIFDDEPDRTYYGIFSGESTLDERNAVGKTTLQFLCPDPYKYGTEETVAFAADGSLDFLNGTNGDIFPTYTISFNQPATFFSIVSDDEQITVGDPAAADQTVVPREQMILKEFFADFTGWTATNTAVDIGTVAGTMEIDTATGGNFVPATFGSGAGWHGPALMKTLSEPLDDFKMEVSLENWSTGAVGKTRSSQVGRVEIYLLDINDQIIGKFAVKDAIPTLEHTIGEARLGGVAGGLHIMNYSGNGTIWNNFDGLIQISRVNNYWSVTIGKFDWATKRHHSRLTANHYDADGRFDQQIAKIQVHFGQHGTHPVTHMLLDTMRVWKINQITTPQIPYIVEADDVVEVETATGGIYKNGIPWMSEMNPMSNFFPLKPGTTPLAFFPSDAATVAMTYRKRWL